MIYSENAPKLENTLHKTFERYRVNFVNRRREYFKLDLDRIKSVVLENHGEFEFIMESEAKEYRESIIIREEMNRAYDPAPKEESFPDAGQLFGS